MARPLPLLGAFLALGFCLPALAQTSVDEPAVTVRPNVNTAGGLPSIFGDPTPIPQADVEEVKPPPFFIRASIGSELTYTDNANFGGGGQARSQTIFDVSPSLAILGSGAHYHVNGAFTLDGVAYSGGSEPNRILPLGSILFNADLVENLLFIDAGVRSVRSVANPYAISSLGPVSSYNEVTTTQYRVSPYLLREITPDVTLLAKSNDLWSSGGQADGTASTNGFYGVQSVRLDSRPLPLGWSAELSSAATRFEGQSTDALKDDALRLAANVAFDPVLLGLIGGFEKAYVDSASVTHAIVGLRAEWHPSLRTQVDATVEERYFGTGWNISAAERTQGLVVRASWQRDVTTYPELLSTQLTTGYVPPLLDALLTSQYPNAVSRQGAVQSLFLTSGLPADLGSAAQVASAQALLIDVASVSAVLVGKLNSLSLTLFRSRTAPYALGGEIVPLSVPLTVFVDDVQTGGAITLNHRLSPTLGVSSTLLRANTAGLGSGTGTSSKQTSLTIQLTDQVALRTSAFVGLRHQILDSNLVNSSVESAVFVGLNHHF